MGDVHRLTLRFCLVRVDQDHFGKKPAVHEGKTGSGTDESASDHSYFSGVYVAHGMTFFLW